MTLVCMMVLKKYNWVISDQTAKELTNMKFEDGRPVLVTSFNDSPFGAHSTILGRAVVINEHVAELIEAGSSIFFGDLKRALIVGERKVLFLQKSTEYGFIRDEIAIKANIRLDIKKTCGDSYIGKYSNSYDNKCVLITAIQAYIDQLVIEGILDAIEDITLNGMI